MGVEAIAQRSRRRASGPASGARTAARSRASFSARRAPGSPIVRIAGWAWRSSGGSPRRGERRIELVERERAARRGRRRVRARGPPRRASARLRPRRAAGWARSACDGERRERLRRLRAVSRASAPASLWPSVRPAESSTSTPQRASSAETRRGDRGIRRDQGGRLARRLERFAHRDGERERLLGLGVGDDDRHAVERGCDRARRQRRRRARASTSVDSAGRSASLRNVARAVSARRRRAERRHVVALDADEADQPMQKRLRMAGEPLRGIVGRRRSSPRRGRRGSGPVRAARPRPGRCARSRR